MTEISGVTIKNVRKFIGMEGEAYQGSVYLDGKRLGFWSQDGNGGCDRYEFDEKQLMPAAEKHAAAKPKDWKYRDLFFKNGKLSPEYLDSFMNDVLCLLLDEKEWKKQGKKGYPIMVIFHDGLSPEEKVETPNAEKAERIIFMKDKPDLADNAGIADYLKKHGYAPNGAEGLVVYRKEEDFKTV